MIIDVLESSDTVRVSCVRDEGDREKNTTVQCSTQGSNEDTPLIWMVINFRKMDEGTNMPPQKEPPASNGCLEKTGSTVSKSNMCKKITNLGRFVLGLVC